MGRCWKDSPFRVEGQEKPEIYGLGSVLFPRTPSDFQPWKQLKGLMWRLGRLSVKLFLWLCPGFPLEGISLRLSSKTLYKEQTFYFTHTSLAGFGS